MGVPGGWELVLIVVVILLLFGGKKIPELAKGLGKGIKDFKEAINEDDKIEAEDKKEIEAKSTKDVSIEKKEETKA